MISNSDEKKTNIKTFKVPNNKMKQIEKYMKEHNIKMFSRFIDSLVDKELNKGRTLFN